MVAALIGLALIVVYFLISGGAVAAVEGTNTVTACCTITNDPATWPSGDRVWNVCHAIAMAEGANVAGSNPDRLNNPGDISDGAGTYGFEVHSGSSVTKFPDKNTGWMWLYAKINNAFVLRQSVIYSPTMTWTDFAKKYAGDWQSWVVNVTGPLNVSPDDVVGDYFSA